MLRLRRPGAAVSIRTACYVGCDVCGDPAEITTRGAQDARNIASNDGWRRVKIDGKTRDVCPRHDDDAPEALRDAVRAWTGYGAPVPS